MKKKKVHKYKEKTIKHFNVNAKNYDNNKSGKHARSMHDEILKKLEKMHFQSILDVGIGTGEILSKILINNKIKAYGIDISPEMIKIASSFSSD